MMKENITITALRLFLLRGYREVSLMDVAKELNITKGGIYHYFTSKEELLHEAVDFLFLRFETQYINFFQSAARIQDILQELIVQRRLERHMQEVLHVTPGDYRLNHARLIMEIMPNFPDLQQRIDASHAKLLAAIEQRVAQGQASGDICSDLDARTLAILLFTLLNGQNFVSPELYPSEMRQQVVDLICQLAR